MSVHSFKMDNDLIRKLFEMEKDLRHKLYEMDKDFIFQLVAMESSTVIHQDITVATTANYMGSGQRTFRGVFNGSGQRTFRCVFNRNGDFSLFCVSARDPTVDVKKCQQNRFIRLNFVVDDDIVKEIREILEVRDKFQSFCWDFDFITMIERIELCLKKYEEKVIEKRKQGEKHLVDITMPNDTLCWFKELRIKRAKDELILELISKYEENKKVMRELDTERYASRMTSEKNLALTLEIDTLKNLLNTERAASKIVLERNITLKQDNDEMTKKLGIIRQKFQAIKDNLCKK